MRSSYPDQDQPRSSKETYRLLSSRFELFNLGIELLFLRDQLFVLCLEVFQAGDSLSND